MAAHVAGRRSGWKGRGDVRSSGGGLRTGSIVRVIGRGDTQDARCPSDAGSWRSVLITQDRVLICNSALRGVQNEIATNDDFLILRVVGRLRRISGRARAVAVEHQHLRRKGRDRRRTNRVSGSGGKAACAVGRLDERPFKVCAPYRATDCASGNSCAKAANRVGKRKRVTGDDLAIEPSPDYSRSGSANRALV